MNGEPDPSDSTFELAVRHIEVALPGMYNIENVVGILSASSGGFFREVLRRLEVGGHYAVHHAILDAKDFGVAQSRRRVFIVGISMSRCKAPFVFPCGSGAATPLSSALGRRTKLDTCMRAPPQSQRNAVRIWRAELDRLHRSGINPERPDRILDVDASVSWSSPSRTTALA